LHHEIHEPLGAAQPQPKSSTTGCAFKRSLRCLYHRDLFRQYLFELKVLWKDFKAFACGITARVHQSALDLAQAAGRPYHYLRSSNISKEDWIRDLVTRDPVRQGLIAVLSCVEAGRTFKVYGNRQTQKLELRLESSRCLHLYFYIQYPRWGLVHLRLQTWYPFLIHIFLSGCVCEPEKLTQELSPVAVRQRLLVTHGTLDPLIPFAEVRGQVNTLKTARLRIEWREFVKAHTIIEPELEVIRAFVQAGFVAATPA